MRLHENSGSARLVNFMQYLPLNKVGSKGVYPKKTHKALRKALDFYK